MRSWYPLLCKHEQRAVSLLSVQVLAPVILLVDQLKSFNCVDGNDFGINGSLWDEKSLLIVDMRYA
jgi:hypothetical protein